MPATSSRSPVRIGALPRDLTFFYAFPIRHTRTLHSFRSRFTCSLALPSDRPFACCYHQAMAHCYGHKTAVTFWREWEGPAPPTHDARWETWFSQYVPGRRDGVIVASFGTTAHLMVPSKSARRKLPNATCHVWECALCEGSLLQPFEEIVVASPELAFLQMARELSLIDLALYGFELCGLFARTPDKLMQRSQPLTTTKRIEAYLTAFSLLNPTGVAGIKKARQALAYMMDGSGSPAESALALFLTCPKRMGGCALPKPRLNEPVNLSPNASRLCGKRRLVCDLYWEAARLAVEYDGIEHHSGKEHIESDAERRNALLSMGIDQMTFTRRQLFDFSKAKAGAREIGRCLGVDSRKLSNIRDSVDPKLWRQVTAYLVKGLRESEPPTP